MHLVFSSEVLKDKDMHYFKDLLPPRVSVHHTLDFTVEPNDVVVLDEGDEWIYDKLFRFR